MEMNFDLLISGCNTRCKHCYVNGGPGKYIPLEDALRCISRLDELASALPASPVPSFTMDNEPFNHPDIVEIIRVATSTKHIQLYHHGMTTGIALMRRKDKESVVKAYMDCGCMDFGITLHGNPEHHDEIVRREGAFQASVASAEYAKSLGAKVSISLMFNRFFPEDAAAIDQVIRQVGPDFIYFAVPCYTPHRNMREFEPYRASLQDLYAISDRLESWEQDKTELLNNAERHTPAAVAKRFEQGLTVKELFVREQNDLYLTVHQDCRLYMGNSGVETACLGDLRYLDIGYAAQVISNASANRDYGAFYAVDRLPTQEEITAAMKRLPPDIAFSDTASVIYRTLAEMDVPTRILSL